MKKFIIIIAIIALVAIGYVVYVEVSKEKIKPLPTEVEKVEVTEYYTYGTSLNINGSLTVENLSFDNIDLVLYDNKEFKSYDINHELNTNTLTFNLSELINEGIYLDNIARGNYYMFLRTTHKEKVEEEEKTTYKYYTLENKTDYKETKYYTMSKYNNKISINSDNNYQTMMLNIEENKDKEIYDIVIDAGHGGSDPGAVINNTKETDFTLDMAVKLKKELIKSGFTVKLTHDENTLSDSQYFDEYGKGGRAQISHEVYAKYLFSLHLNSSGAPSINGVEIYTAGDINYDFVKDLANEIVNDTGIKYSNKKTFKMYNGVYTHNFTEEEIENAIEGYEKKNYTPYEVTTKSSYLYMIRETGGIMTGAYVDNRNEAQTGNDYYNSNVGTEAYLIEMCYLSNLNDLNIISENKDKYISAISKSISKNLNK